MAATAAGPSRTGRRAPGHTMLDTLLRFRHSLAAKVILTAGLALLVVVSLWSYFNIRTQQRTVMEDVVSDVDRLSKTIILGTHYAMLLDAENDTQEIVSNVSRQEDIRSIRIYNKQGEIKFSNDLDELGERTHIKQEACYVCHKTNPPLAALDLDSRTRIMPAVFGQGRALGIMSPIYNEPSCWESAACHVHPPGKKVLGLLDMVVSLEETDAALFSAKRSTVVLAVFVFSATFSALFLFTHIFVHRPVKQLIAGTREIAGGRRYAGHEISQEDEVGELARAIEHMGREVLEKHAELVKQKTEYQNLFALVPCIITVQDRDFKLVSYNREFKEKFDPQPGQHCYEAYKGRTSRCEQCPVQKTFIDGKSYTSEESGLDKDGTPRHWFVTTSPIRDERGAIVAAMEMCLDITPRKQLEEKLEISEKKYHAIFSNIPNSVFVLDARTLAILDSNEKVPEVYNFGRNELLGRSFLDLFSEDEREHYRRLLPTAQVVHQARQLARDGRPLYVDIFVSPSRYNDTDVLLVATSDITNRLETEQQLIQASKMATLGEMATGVAHELNQPLSVLRTIGGLILRKTERSEQVPPELLAEMAQGISEHVERASKIINHMREFGRKPDINTEPVSLNEVFRRTFEIFSQQLTLRSIEVSWDLDPDLPLVLAEPNRMEQVFINLLINARDAIQERWESDPPPQGAKRIEIRSRARDGKAVVEVSDTGTGIPAARLDKLFEPFFTTKGVGKGTGLGLSISYGIIQDYGGSIRAENTPQGGARFVIEMPPG